MNILLIELSRSVWENLDLGHEYRPYCVQSVLTTLVKILPYRPPARLIRANNYLCLEVWWWKDIIKSGTLYATSNNYFKEARCVEKLIESSLQM